MRKVIIFILMLGVFSMASEMTVAELLQKMQANRAQISSYTAEVVNLTEGAFITGQKLERGRIYFLAPDKIRSEISGANPQITLTVGEDAWIIDKAGSITQLASENNSLDKQFRDPLEVFNKFDFVLSALDKNRLKLTGIPKKNIADDLLSNRFFSKIVFLIEREKYLTKEIVVYSKNGHELARINTEYQVISNINFPVKTTTKLSIGSSSFQVITSYQNIQLNQPLNLELFDLQKIRAEVLNRRGD